MKKAFTIVLALALVVAATPVFAGDGNVSSDTLFSLGLSDLQQMTDAEGLQVRGMSSNAAAFGASLTAGQLSDPLNPGNFLVQTDVNGGRGSDENAGLSVNSLATQGPQGSSIAANLSIQSGNPAVQVFLGAIAANAGNAANVGAAGISAATAN